MTPADAVPILEQLPASLWPVLLQGVRKASDALGRKQLPAGLQPYAGFAPARLGKGPARAAVIAALSSDARLRELIGKSLGDEVWEQAADAPALDLASRHGSAGAVAALVARERWEDVAALARHEQEAQPAASQPQPQPQPNARAGEGDRAAVAASRRERAAAQKRAEAAEQRVTALQQEIDDLRRRLTAAEAERDDAQRRYDEERRRSRDRMARLQRRVTDAEARARADAARLAGVAGELERLASRLRVRGDGESEVPAPAVVAPAAAAPAGGAPRPVIPRLVRAAAAGRPCVLPAGITPSQTAAATALLAVSGIAVVVDGYNVTKDLRGVPTAGLPEQRAWLERLLAGVAAGREMRMTAVFDGEGERTSAAAAARIVRCVFTASQETADERIVAIVSALPDTAPVLVVSSDREVAAACEALGVNVIASGVFLAAVG